MKFVLKKDIDVNIKYLNICMPQKSVSNVIKWEIKTNITQYKMF